MPSTNGRSVRGAELKKPLNFTRLEVSDSDFMTVDCKGNEIIVSATPVSHDWLVGLKLDFNFGFLAIDVPYIHASIYTGSCEEVFVFGVPGEGADG